jgi:hypothetical protein
LNRSVEDLEQDLSDLGLPENKQKVLQKKLAKVDRSLKQDKPDAARKKTEGLVKKVETAVRKGDLDAGTASWLIGDIWNMFGNLTDSSVRCALIPSVATNLLRQSHIVTAVVTKDGQRVEGVAVHFRVKEGPNKGQSADATTNAEGLAAVQYAGLKGIGSDLIEASGEVDGEPFACTAAKVWIGDPQVSAAFESLFNTLFGLDQETSPKNKTRLIDKLNDANVTYGDTGDAGQVTQEMQEFTDLVSDLGQSGALDPATAVSLTEGAQTIIDLL